MARKKAFPRIPASETAGIPRPITARARSAERIFDW
jgi:hypothetical protein